MGKLRFSKIAKFFALCLLGTAVVIAAVAVLSSPAVAQNPSGGNLDALKSWNTDNLARWVSSNVGQVGAKNYRIPYHNYRASGYRSSVEAKACVAYNIYDNDGNLQAVHLQARHTRSSRQAATPGR